LFQLYQAFATPDETAALAKAYADGIAWGEAKQVLFERLDQEIAPLRAVYDELIKEPEQIEKTLKAGADKARSIATPFTARLRHAVGLRPLQAITAPSASKDNKGSGPVFKQYREQDGLFYFKLLDAQGALLLQSKGFTAPRDAAQAMALLQREGSSALEGISIQIANLGEIGVLDAALRHFRDSAA
jgi:tryptophanyl-tRNA synthetase